MGLMYVFPVGEDETDFVIKDGDVLTLKTYGLPYIFWFYALCSIAMIFFMFLGIKEPVLKLVSMGDDTDALLGYSLLTFIGLLPVFILAFFFYEKRIVKNKNQFSLIHKIFGITVFSEKFLIEKDDDLKVEAFIDSPNVARKNSREDNVGFQNKGYFVLWLKSSSGQKILIDRHSRKADLEKLKKLLTTNN